MGLDVSREVDASLVGPDDYDRLDTDVRNAEHYDDGID